MWLSAGPDAEFRYELAPAPKGWGEAWSDMAGASFDMMRFRDNANASDEAIIAAYERRNKAIYDATGVELKNPAYIYQDNWRPRGAATYSMETEGEQIRARSDALLAEWRGRTAELAAQHPDQAALFADTAMEDARAITRAAGEAFDEASARPELGFAGRLTATLAGGGAGMMRDPVQVSTIMAGAPASAGATVAARIGRVFLYEAAINAGVEGLVQTMAEPWRRDAGAPSTWQDVFLNVGLAGAVGGIAGGAIQGGAELYRALGMAGEAAEAADRLVAGAARPGDAEAVAAATGRPLTETDRAVLARAFEDDAMDGFTAPADAPPERLMVMEAARRFAEDPDNNPPPELVERMLADRMAPDVLDPATPGRLYDLDETFAEAAPEPAPGRLAPERAAEPDSAEAMRIAEEAATDPKPPAEPVALDAAGPEAPPARNRNGQLADPWRGIADYDADGNIVYRTVEEWLDDAEIPNAHADLLEACNL